MFHSEVLYLQTWSSALPLLIYPQPCPYNVGYSVAAQICKLSILSQIRFLVGPSQHLRVICSVITLVSGVFFLESGSDTACCGNHNTTIPVIDTSRKSFWDAMFSQEKKG